MPETPQQSLLRRMFGNRLPSEAVGVSQPTKEPGMLQRFMGRLSDTINNPALINSILGPNQMLQIQDEKLDPNLVLGRGPISKSYGASGSWTPNINLDKNAPQNQLTWKQRMDGIHKLREMAPE